MVLLAHGGGGGDYLIGEATGDLQGRLDGSLQLQNGGHGPRGQDAAAQRPRKAKYMVATTSAGYLEANWPETFGSVFGRLSAKQKISPADQF